MTQERNALNLTSLERKAAEVLTDKQFAAWFLWQRGAGYQRIANHLGVGRSTVRGHVRAALDRLKPYIDEEAA